MIQVVLVVIHIDTSYVGPARPDLERIVTGLCVQIVKKIDTISEFFRSGRDTEIYSEFVFSSSLLVLSGV